MTTVVALAQDGNVHMAADTTTNVYDRPIFGVRKICRVEILGIRALIGVSGDGAFCHLLPVAINASESALLRDKTVRSAGDSDTHIAHTIAEALTELAVARGLVDDGRMNGNFLLGFKGQLWTLVHQQAIAHPDGLAAIGSGEGPAMGCLWALATREGGGRLPMTPGLAVTYACRAAIRFDRYSGGVVQVESVREDGVIE